MCAGSTRTGPLAVVPSEWSARTAGTGGSGSETGGGAAVAGLRRLATAFASRANITQDPNSNATTPAPTHKQRATCRAAPESGIDFPYLLGAVTRDVPTIDETQCRFFMPAFFDRVRAALVKRAARRRIQRRRHLALQSDLDAAVFLEQRRCSRHQRARVRMARPR